MPEKPEKSEVAHTPAGLSRTFTSWPEEIAALPDVLVAWAEAQGVGMRTINYVNLMLDELVSNIARHAYEGRADGRIELSASFDDFRCVSACVITDRPLILLCQSAPETALDIEARELGGLGIHFVKKMADHLSYRRDGDANEIIFCRREVKGSIRRSEVPGLNA